MTKIDCPYVFAYIRPFVLFLMCTLRVLWCSLASGHHGRVSPGIFSTSLTPSCIHNTQAHTLINLIHSQKKQHLLYLQGLGGLSVG